MSRQLKAYILLTLVTLVWGATFVVIKNALADISPLLFNAIRMSLAAVALALIYFSHLKRMSRPTLLMGALVGALLFGGYALQTTGLKFTTPSKSAFLTGVSVVLVPVFLAFFWRKRVNRWTAVGVGSGMIGLYLLTIPGEGGTLRAMAHTINRGDLLTATCAVVFAFQIIFLGRAIKAHPWQQIAVVQIAVAATLMFCAAPAFEAPRVLWSPAVIWAILITGLLGTAAAFTTQAWAQQFMPPTQMGLIFSLEPVFAWITSFLVLGERLGVRASMGAILILGGVFLSEIKGGTTDEPALLGL